MRMFKYCGFPFLFIVVIFPIISTKLIIKNSKKDRDTFLLKEVAATLLGKCNLGLKNILIYDHSHGSPYVQTIATLQPPMIVSVAEKVKSFMSLNETLTKNEVEGVIFIFNPHHAIEKNFMRHVVDKLPLTRNCTIIIIPYSYPRCFDVKPIFLALKELYIFTAYYICLLNNEPRIITHDVYGEIQPSLWIVHEREIFGGNTWTLYRRHFRKDTICQKFHFNRINLKENSQSANIIIGMISRGRTIAQSSIHNKGFPKKLKKSTLYYEDVAAVKRLLKMNFKYYFSSQKPIDLYRNTSIDVVFSLYFMSHQRSFWHVSYPLIHEEYVILSNNRGFCTPLENIADFYGLWTLISLIVILTITFFVIWYKTNKNIPSATFDILRLLINGGVDVPINTGPLKIFFSMIFLYFLVIHATFSGHLAEFLTKTTLRKNIDSIEDALMDSRIIDLYNFGFHYSDSSTQDIYNRKSILTYELTSCIHHVKHNKSSACIGFKSGFNSFMKKNDTGRYYIH